MKSYLDLFAFEIVRFVGAATALEWRLHGKVTSNWRVRKRTQLRGKIYLVVTDFQHWQPELFGRKAGRSTEFNGH